MAYPRGRRRDRRPRRRCLIGEDPRRIEHLWQMMFRQHFWHGSGIVRATAMSGIDIALWDIAGQGSSACPATACGAARCATTCGSYCHLGGGKMEDFYETPVANARPLRRPGARGGGRRLHRLQVDGRAADHAARGHRPGAGRRSRRWRACARPWAPASTSWSIAMPGRRPRWACCSPRRWSPTVCISSKSRAGRRVVEASAAINAVGHHADRHRRAADRPHAVPRSVRGARLRASPSSTSRIAAA